MKTILFLTWRLSNAIGDIALLAMLGGVFLAAWAMVRLVNAEGRSSVPAAWTSAGAKTGVRLFVFGLVLGLLTIAVRLSLPVP